MLPFLLFFTLPFCCVLPQTMAVGDTVVLPALGVGDCDHATVAVNQNGDVLVCWQTRVGTGPFAPHQVEAALFPSLGSGSWGVPASTDLVLLGDPALAILAPGEHCRKPDVLARGNDFLVVWPRDDPGSGVGLLEGARISPNGSSPIVDSAAPGQGWLLDGGVTAGSAGLMPDLAPWSAQPFGATVVYVHESLVQGGIHEYALRVQDLDFGTSPPTLSGIQTLETGIPYDDGNIAPVGGRVLPDAVEDDFQNLVVAWEEYREVGHGGATLADGRIRVRRYSRGSGAYAYLDGFDLQNRDPSYRSRRPNLATSHFDVGNRVSVAWGDFPDSFLHDDDVRYGELLFEGGSTAGAVRWTNFGFPNLNNRDHDLPVPLHARGLRVCIQARFFVSQRFLTAYAAMPAWGEVLVPGSQAFAWRPAAAMLDHLPGGQRLTALCYEAPGPQGRIRIFLALRLL